MYFEWVHFRMSQHLGLTIDTGNVSTEINMRCPQTLIQDDKFRIMGIEV